MKQFERKIQVARALQKEIGALIQRGGVKDDRMATLVSIVDVTLNSSLSSARVTYSVLSAEGDESAHVGTQAALGEHAGYIRGVVGRKLNLRYAPKLYFTASDSLSKSVDMVDLINRTVEGDNQNHSFEDEAIEEE